MSRTRSLIIHFLVAMLVSALAMAISIHTQLTWLPDFLDSYFEYFTYKFILRGWVLVLSGGLVYFFARIKVSQIKNPEYKKDRASLWLVIPVMLIAALIGGFISLRGYATFNSKFEDYISKRYNVLFKYSGQIEAIFLSLIVSKTGLDRAMEQCKDRDSCHFSPTSLRILSIFRDINKDALLLSELKKTYIFIDTKYRDRPIDTNIENIKVLLTHGANVNGRQAREKDPYESLDSNEYSYSSSNTMLMNAALYANDSDSAEKVKLLLDNGADPKLTNDNGSTALHFVSHPQTATLLLKAGIDINARDKNSQTPLHYLIDRTYDIFCDDISMSRSDWCEISHQLIKYLIATGADINAQDADGRTPLYIAVKNGFAFRSFNAIKILLESGANPNLPNKAGITPLKLAYQDKLDKETIKLLIAHGAKRKP